MKVSLLNNNLKALATTAEENLAVESNGRLYRREAGSKASEDEKAAIAKAIEGTKASYLNLDRSRWAKMSSLHGLKAKLIFEKIFHDDSFEDFKIFHNFLKGKKLTNDHLELWLIAQRLGCPALAKESIEKMTQLIELKDFPGVKTCPPELVPDILDAVENAKKIIDMIEKNDQENTAPFISSAKKALIAFINDNKIPFFAISENRKASEMIRLLASEGKDLQYVDLQEEDFFHHDLEVTHADLDELTQHFPNIKYLRVGSDKIKDNTIELVAARLHGITTLSLGWCGITDASAPFIVEGLKELTSLDLNRCDITDIGAASLAEGLKALTKLNLSFCNITDAGAASIVEGLTTLKILNLSWCHITDIGVKMIVENLTELIKLNLGYNSKITNESARIIAKGSKNLTTLKLSRCRITDDGVALLAEKLKQLTKLHLDSCAIGNVGAAYLAEGLTELTNLSLSHCPITDEGVASIAKGLTKLTNLDLKFCKITDASARSISDRLKKLTTLVLSDNKKITLDSVALLAFKLPDLTMLDVSLCKKIKKGSFDWPNENLEIIF